MTKDQKKQKKIMEELDTINIDRMICKICGAGAKIPIQRLNGWLCQQCYDKYQLVDIIYKDSFLSVFFLLFFFI